MSKDIRILFEGDILEELKNFPGWSYEDDKIKKELNLEIL
jgi:hypothetical protein